MSRLLDLVLANLLLVLLLLGNELGAPARQAGPVVDNALFEAAVAGLDALAQALHVCLADEERVFAVFGIGLQSNDGERCDQDRGFHWSTPFVVDG